MRPEIAIHSIRTSIDNALKTFDYEEVKRILSTYKSTEDEVKQPLENFQTSTSDSSQSAAIQEYKRKAALDLGCLDLSNINAADAIAVGLRNNSFFTSIDLDKCQINDAEIEKIALALHNHPTITEVNFSNNKISNIGVISLALAIEQNPKLISIRFDGNKIGDKGAIKIAYAVVNHKNITSVNLSYNQIGDKGAEMLRRCLKRNNILEELDLSNNKKIDVDILTAISNKLDINSQSKKSTTTSTKIIEVEFAAHDPKIMGYSITSSTQKSNFKNESKSPTTAPTNSSAQSIQDEVTIKNSNCCAIS